MKLFSQAEINRMFTEQQNAIRCFEVKHNLEPTDFHSFILRLHSEPQAVLIEMSQMMHKKVAES